MVKGVSKQVVVVRSLDTRLFEQAIFMLRDGAAARHGVTEEDILREANAAAEVCLRERPEKKQAFGLRELWWTLCGAAAVGAVWLLTALLPF